MTEHPYTLEPCTEHDLLEWFHSPGSIAKHLLSLYSFAIGLNAKRIVDIGIGSTTRVLRLAATKTNGKVMSCDVDVQRFSSLLEQQTESWSLSLCPSEKFLRELEAPIDYAVHDGAHDYFQVKLDLSLLIPKMRKYGLICIHDTQQTELSHELLKAIKDTVQDFRVSMTTLPFSCGLTILRVEECAHPPIDPTGTPLPDGRFDTAPVTFPTYINPQESYDQADSSLKRWLRWRLRKIIKGY